MLLLDIRLNGIVAAVSGDANGCGAHDSAQGNHRQIRCPAANVNDQRAFGAVRIDTGTGSSGNRLFHQIYP